MSAIDYEQLGVFYLGKAVGLDGSKSEDLVLYDSKDLTTHALVVGMTGSGKTGLSIGLLEEAAIDGLPALVIDPKGDLGNLLLTFPELSAQDFKPWIDPAEATRAGKSTDEFAAWSADLWRKGLEDWGQSGERIERFRAATDLTIYTPGASMGMPLSVMKSFTAPSQAVRRDPDALRERVDGATAGLLALLGIEADPVQSREYILLANLMQHAWTAGKDMDLASFIQEIQKPPFDRLGVIDLETFYPSKDRLSLAMRLNGLLASPGFGAWLEGEPLDVGALLYRPDGRPRISIVSIAHLSDAERMFVVTLLLNEVVSWMRSQSGTSSLRALLYMDEIYGYFPPTRNPPSKVPMLTLLKQARAYGLGCVLATQNPVDLDYKGLSNCGSWFIGRLQTEQDKNRVLDGLQSAAASAGTGFDRPSLSSIIGGLDKRVFLLNNVHEDGPQLFRTRWVMSYLRGPLMRDQISALMAEKKSLAAQGDGSGDGAASRSGAAGTVGQQMTRGEASVADEPLGERRPVVGDGIEELFVTLEEALGHGERVLYRPEALGQAQLHYRRASYDVDSWVDVTVVAPFDEKSIVWDDAEIEGGDGPALGKKPAPGANFASLPAVAQRETTFSRAQGKLKTHLYRSRPMTLYKHRETGLLSAPDEGESEFRRRVQQGLAETRDAAVEKLREQFARKLASVEGRIRTAEDRIDREQSQLRDRKLQTAISFGTSLLGAVMGRKTLNATTRSGAARALRDVGRSRREGDDVDRAEERLEDLLADKKKLEEQFEQAAAELKSGLAPTSVELESVDLAPLKTDLAIQRVALVWRPWALDGDGVARRLW